MRQLRPADQVSDDDLAQIFAPGRPQWLRVVMVSTVDGAANGPDQLSGSINNEVDHRIFGLLRDQCDVVLVGSATAEIEGYDQLDKPLVLISRSGRVPAPVRNADRGTVRMAVPVDAAEIDDAIQTLGAENVFALGTGEVDMVALRQRLHQEYDVINCEGGPRILGALLAAGQADEIDVTITPLVIGGSHPRIVSAESMQVDLELVVILLQDSTLICRWLKADHG